ncbi:bone morphogenetic protein 15 [Hemicordylus capensis]|uniref:bone morphogenetic protein 15 n=1 Tax=Hemicordylus capensis TaxID=884348 RepID=UPI0023022704|nr:bone morphogenetic protein 15 [Hemicordylus capensis]XP_053129335.1 bone morphogenetic protein 15 [Hemicordylus capensis]
MAGQSPWRPCGALFLLAVLFPLELSLREGRGAPVPEDAPSAAPSLPLIQMLLGQVPPRARLPARHRRRAGGPPLRFMLDLYRSVADRHGRPRRNRHLATNTVRLVRPFAKNCQPEAGPRLLCNLDYRLEVQLPEEHLVKATVVYSRTLASAAHGPSLCTTRLLSGLGALPQAPVSLAHPHADPTTNATRFPAQDSWVEMDLPSFLQPWVWSARQSQVLQLHRACAFVGEPGDPTPEPGWESAVSLEDPFLLLYLNDTRRRALRPGSSAAKEAPFHPRPPRRLAQARRTRQAGRLALDLPSYIRVNYAKQGECALHPFRVSFSQLGWDHWIIAPHWYRPQYCKGGCPRLLRLGYNSPNHAIVQNLINELVDQSVPRPSCVPYEYSPISVLMIEPNGNILYKVYEDMIAKSCTCR